MHTEFGFGPRTREILTEVLQRGIEALKDGQISKPSDLGVLASSFSIALENHLEGFTKYKEAFETEFNLALSGDLLNPSLFGFLGGFANTGSTQHKDGSELNRRLLSPQEIFAAQEKRAAEADALCRKANAAQMQSRKRIADTSGRIDVSETLKHFDK